MKLELRDRFAIAALQGLLAAEVSTELKIEDYAADAYRLADAMLAERETVPPRRPRLRQGSRLAVGT